MAPLHRNGQQKRKKTDAFSAEGAITYGSLLLRFAQAPKNTIAYAIFDTLRRAGAVEYYSNKDSDDQMLVADDEVRDKKIFQAIDTSKGVEPVNFRKVASAPNTASTWSPELSWDFAVLDIKKLPLLMSPVKANPNTYLQSLEDPIFNVLDGKTKEDWIEKYEKFTLAVANANTQPEKFWENTMSLINAVVRDSTSNGTVDAMMQQVLSLSTHHCKLLRYRPKFEVDLPYRGSHLAAVFDFAIVLKAWHLQTKDNVPSNSQIKTLLTPIQQLVAFVNKEKYGASSAEVHGQMVAQMLVQAALNFNVWTEARYADNTMEFPKHIRDIGKFYATAIKVVGTKFHIYRADIPEDFILTVVKGAVADDNNRNIKKFVVREYESPSGVGFDITNIHDLRAFVNFLVTFMTDCEREVLLKQGSQRSIIDASN